MKTKTLVLSVVTLALTMAHTVLAAEGDLRRYYCQQSPTAEWGDSADAVFRKDIKAQLAARIPGLCKKSGSDEQLKELVGSSCVKLCSSKYGSGEKAGTCRNQCDFDKKHAKAPEAFLVALSRMQTSDGGEVDITNDYRNAVKSARPRAGEIQPGAPAANDRETPSKGMAYPVGGPANTGTGSSTGAE